MSDAATTDSSAPDENSGPKELREAFERTKAQLAERDKMIEELTSKARGYEFDKVGVPNDKWGAKFRELYQGDLTPEAIKSEVESWGLSLESDQPAPAPEANPADAAIAAEFDTLTQAQAVRGMSPAGETSDRLLAELQELGNGDYTNADIENLFRQHGRLAES